MKKYKHIFFDLDDTLWDFKKNSKESLIEVYKNYNLDKWFENSKHFLDIYHKHNDILWERYRKQEITKYTLGMSRFLNTLNEVGVNEAKFALKLNTEYLSIASTKTTLVPNAISILNYISKKYLIHIITNGFFEVQFVKIRNSKIDSFITHIITSEECKSLKPDPEIFNFALEKIEAKPSECIMIGDKFNADIIGAKNVGIDQVFFNRNNQEKLPKKPTFEIKELNDLKDIL